MIVERGSRQSSGRCQLGRDHLIKLGVETKLGFAQEAGCQKHMSLGCNGYGSKLLDPQNGWLINFIKYVIYNYIICYDGSDVSRS